MVTLEGRYVRLEPLSLSHHAALCEVGLDPELWRWTPAAVRSPDDMRAYIQTALDWQAAGTAIPYATVERASGRVVGSTRFANIDRAHRRGEIGWTWVARNSQRTPINTEAKFLMLRHAFETLGWMRVEFKTDSLNTRSRNALLRIGAKPEGVFRNHMLTESGRIRHTVWFSITDAEWPGVRAELETKLAARQPAGGPVRIDCLNDAQIEDLHRMYQQEWWTEGRTLEDVRKMLDATKVLVGFADPVSEKLLAFTRVITDFVFKALVLDVIVDSSVRATGLGRMLMDAVVNHPELKRVKHFELYCRPELAEFYAQWEFAAAPADLKFMRRG